MSVERHFPLYGLDGGAAVFMEYNVNNEKGKDHYDNSGITKNGERSS